MTRGAAGAAGHRQAQRRAQRYSGRHPYRLFGPHADRTVARPTSASIGCCSAIRRTTGSSVFINTSFNVRDEPIVCTPGRRLSLLHGHRDGPAGDGQHDPAQGGSAATAARERCAGRRADSRPSAELPQAARDGHRRRDGKDRWWLSLPGHRQYFSGSRRRPVTACRNRQLGSDAVTGKVKAFYEETSVSQL